MNGESSSHSKSRSRQRSPAPKEHRRSGAHRDESEEDESKKSRRVKVTHFMCSVDAHLLCIPITCITVQKVLLQLSNICAHFNREFQ